MMITLRRRPPRCHVTTDHNGPRAGLHHCQTHITRWYGTENACPDHEPPRPSLWARLAPSREAASLIVIALVAGGTVTVLVVVLVLIVATAAGAL